MGKKKNIFDEGNDALDGEPEGLEAALLRAIRFDSELYSEQMELHPEYRRFLEQSRLDETCLDDTGQEVNPHLHLTSHVILEKQIRFNSPPFVRETIERLEASGHDPHEARHAVMGVLAEMMRNVMTEQYSFDAKRYREELKRLR